MSHAKKRARELGIPFDGKPGRFNSITDVPGVLVGHRHTQVHPDVNTGVTAILPRGNDGGNGVGNGIDTFVFAAGFSLNGNGEMTGTTWIDESGILEGPIMLTNTVSVGTVRDGVIRYSLGQQEGKVDPDDFGLYLPVVAETYDGWLNDVLGFHVTEVMVADAIDHAKGGHVEEGNVGGGAGMTCYDWKGGIGTSSRIAVLCDSGDGTVTIGNFTVGVLVQANQGRYWDLVIRGVPVGTRMTPPQSPDHPPRCPGSRVRKSSIIVVIATDAPLLPHQLKRLARRGAHGIARTGTITNNDSGELFLAFSTANRQAFEQDGIVGIEIIPNDSIDPLFEAVVEATEEAVINALIAAETLEGRDGHKAWAITDPHLQDQPNPNPSLVDVMKEFNRWVPPGAGRTA
jgi:L-aminopeptidase/D-esterase-like protein